MTACGDRVVLRDGRAGWVIGWQGPDPIVELDNGRTVTVDFRDVRRVRG